MLAAADLIRLPYPPALTQAGIAFVCRRLACTYLSEQQKTYIAMRDRTASTAADLALRRYLSDQEVPHSVQSALPFSDPASYAVRLGNRRCQVKTDLVFDRNAIHDQLSQPEKLLNRLIQLEVSDLDGDLLLDNDLLIFALVHALITRHPQELSKALAAGQPACLIHTLPERWANPLPDATLRNVAVKSNKSLEIRLEVGGRDMRGAFQQEVLLLPPQVKTFLEQPFQSLAYLRLDKPTASTLWISSKSLQEPCPVGPGQWGNIWIYGMQVILAGYLTREEFRNKGELQVDRDFNQPAVSGKKKSLPYRELRPLTELFARARKLA